MSDEQWNAHNAVCGCLPNLPSAAKQRIVVPSEGPVSAVAVYYTLRPAAIGMRYPHAPEVVLFPSGGFVCPWAIMGVLLGCVPSRLS